MKTLEDQIAAILKTGRRPIIHCLPGMQVTPPKLPRRGRPRVRHPDWPCAHYEDIRAGGRRTHPPRCLRSGCQKRLRVHQRGACCADHADWVVSDALLKLRAVDVKQAELMQLYED